MFQSNTNQISAGSSKDASMKKNIGDAKQRSWLSVTLMIFGIGLGISSLALVSNQFGNTDTLGLLLFGLAAWVLVTGIGHSFMRLPYAALVGLFAAPVFVVLLFVLYWVALFSTAFQNRDHQDFAAKGVSQVPTATQMEELYVDCRHYITYRSDGVPLFNSVAYFGDRYQLTMQVPVRIDSATSGATTGEPKYYLSEIRNVTVLPSGQVSASFSDGVEFGADDWKRVYESQGDYSKIGFKVDPTPVPNFRSYQNASQPSN